MQPIIEITSTKTATKTGKARATGRDYTIINQRGHFHSLDPITAEVVKVSIDVPLESAESPYPVGRYTVDASSFRVSEFGQLTLSRMRLDPVQPVVASVPQSVKNGTNG